MRQCYTVTFCLFGSIEEQIAIVSKMTVETF